MSDVINAVLAQYEANTKFSNKRANISNEDRLKKYFITTLPKNKLIGRKVFRILPPKNGKSPFVEVWFHEIKIGTKWVKLYCPNKNKTGECPLCEVERSLKETGRKEDEKIAVEYRARKFYIVKGIDRELEEDGPKFWRFRHNFEKQGVLDKIAPIFATKGDITHIETGRDLILSLAKDDSGYTKVQTILPEDVSPLHKDPELARMWVEDPTTWEDVYSKKSYDYLDIVARGEIPYWDNELGKYITKTEWEKKNNNGVTVEVIDEDEETSFTIGGKTSSEVSDGFFGTKLASKSFKKSDSKYTSNQIELVDEYTDESDVEMSDLPF